MSESIIRVANAPCSWGVLEFGLEGQAAGYAQVLDEIAATGYAGTELGDWGFMPTDPAALRAELDRRGLTLMAAFVPVALKDRTTHAAGEGVAVRTARLLREAAGEECFIVLADANGTVPVRTKNAGRISPIHGLTEPEWETFADGVERIAAAVRRTTGLRTVFHHHCAGYIETPSEIDRLMTMTDPQLVGLVLDTGHAMFGGGDPLAMLRHYRDRIWHVHFKDFDPQVAAQGRAEGWDYFEAVRHGIFCELGKGAVNFPAVLADLKAHGYSGWVVVEQDVLPSLGSPKASAQRNRDYLRSIGL